MVWLGAISKPSSSELYNRIGYTHLYILYSDFTLIKPETDQSNAGDRIPPPGTLWWPTHPETAFHLIPRCLPGHCAWKSASHVPYSGWLSASHTHVFFSLQFISGWPLFLYQHCSSSPSPPAIQKESDFIHTLCSSASTLPHFWVYPVCPFGCDVLWSICGYLQPSALP